MRRVTSLTLAWMTAAALALPAVAQVQDWRQLSYPPLPSFQIPRPEVITLPNGLTVLLLEDRELPLIEVSARIRTGSNYEPADKVGIANLMATVQRTGGTARMTGDQIDDFLALRAAEIETGMGADFGSARMSVLKDDFDDVLKVFVEILRQPAFAADKLEIAKVQANAAIARRNDSVGAVTAREFRKLVYGPDSPLATTTEYATIAAISRDDLAAWHARYYHPNAMLLAVVGDFEPAAMRRKLQAAFSDWRKGATVQTPKVPFRSRPLTGIHLVEKSDVNQSNIQMGHLGMEVTTSPDFFASKVLNEILGGSFSSRLFANIRTRKGLAYSVYGGIGANFTTPGLFNVGLQTKSESTVEAVKALQEEVRRIIEDPPSDEEMSRAKESILNSFIFNYDTRAKVAAQQLVYTYYGLPGDFLEQYRSNIEKVSREDVTRVAKRYIDPAQVAILVVGRPADFGTPLETLGAVNRIDITIPPPPDRTPKVEKTAAGIEEGRALLAGIVKALGGEAPSSVDAIRSSGTMTINMGGQSMSMKRTVLIDFPDRLRQAMQTPMGEQVVVLAGEGSFMSFGGQVRPIPAEKVQEEARDLARDLRFIVRYHDDESLEAVAGPPEEVDGEPCRALAVTLRGVASRLCAAADGRVLAQSYQGKHPLTQAPAQIENRFSDYRMVDGHLVPHTQVVLVDGEEVMVMKLESFEVNPVIDPALFARPNS
jgi:zinc protease